MFDITRNILKFTLLQKNENIPSSTWRHSDPYKTLTNNSETTQKFTFAINNTSEKKIPHLLRNVKQETTIAEHPSSTISVPIIAFLDSAEMSNDKIDMPIAAVLPIRDDTSMKDQLNLLEKRRDEIQSNIQRYTVGKPWSTDANNLRFTPFLSQVDLYKISGDSEIKN